jgi:hypothetical protein
MTVPPATQPDETCALLFFNAICAKQSDGGQGKNTHQSSLQLLAEEKSMAMKYMRLWKSAWANPP